MYKETFDLIESSDFILLITHPTPDPDAFGSCMSLKYFIKDNFNKESLIAFFDLPTFKYNDFLIKKDDFEIFDFSKILLKLHAANSPLLIVLDIGSLTGRISEIKNLVNEVNKLKIINIDHHVNSGSSIEEKRIITINHVQKSISTTSVLLNLYRRRESSYISSNVALFTILGIYGDSEGFRDLGMNTKMFSDISFCIKLGAEIDKLILALDRSKNINVEKAISAAMQMVKIDRNYAYIVLNNKQLSNLKNIYGYFLDKSDVLTKIKNFDGIKFAFVIFETQPGKISVSLKSRVIYPKILKVAQLFGGGGHEKSCAFRYFFNTSFDEEVNKIVKAIEKMCG